MAKVQEEYESDKEIEQIKTQISELKANIQSTNDPEKLGEYETQFKKLINKK